MLSNRHANNRDREASMCILAQSELGMELPKVVRLDLVRNRLSACTFSYSLSLDPFTNGWYMPFLVRNLWRRQVFLVTPNYNGEQRD